MRSNVVHHSEGVGQRYIHYIGHGSDRCDAIAGKTKSYGHRESPIAACQPSNKLIQRSKAPLKELAARHGLNPKTVAKWLKRASCTSPVLDLFPTLWRLLGDVRCLTTGGHGGRRPGRRKLTLAV